MFIVETKKEQEIDNELRLIYSKCKCVLSNNNYMDYVVETLNSSKTGYVDNKTCLLLQDVFFGILHYASKQNVNIDSVLFDNEHMVTSFKVRYNDLVLCFTEYDNDSDLLYKCSIDNNLSKTEPIDFKDLSEYYINFNPSKPHDKQRKLGEGR